MDDEGDASPVSRPKDATKKSRVLGHLVFLWINVRLVVCLPSLFPDLLTDSVSTLSHSENLAGAYHWIAVCPRHVPSLRKARS